ncbi:hypothetical protein BH10BDE1_BH10BDE1_17660 [soil metagenome]
MRKVGSSPSARTLVIRTFVLTTGLGLAVFLAAWFFFVSREDAFDLIWILGAAALANAAVGYRWIVVPSMALVQYEANVRQVGFTKRFNEIIDNMPEGVIIYSPDGPTEWNRAALKIMGISALQLQQIDSFPLNWNLTTDSGGPMPHAERPSQLCFKTGIPGSALMGVRRLDGTNVWVQTNTSPMFAPRSEEERRLGVLPKVASVVVTLRDVTSEREALHRLELAMKAVQLGIWDFDMTTGRVVWDEINFKLFGVEPGKAVITFDFFVSMIVPEDRERVKRALELAVSECADLTLEYRIRRPNGLIRVLRCESKGFYSSDGKPLRHVGVNWDVTAQREQELRVLHASKMSTLGEMSAGIAHEINNPLAIIVGKTEALRRTIESPAMNSETLLRHVDVLERTAHRIAKIVRGLRTFSRDGDQDPFEVTNVSELVSEVVSLCSSRFSNTGVALTVSNVPSDLVIDVRAVQISQVILNLLINAFEAASKFDEKWVRVEAEFAGGEIIFSITDSGNGISESIRAKMTQPFFTTKDVGMGTGLGLSIASGIVKAHGGTLEFDSSCPNTRFVVRLPRAQKGSVVNAA